MGNAHVKPHPRTRNKKQVHWKAAARPQRPGKPQLVSETEATPDLVTICWTPPASDGGSPISGYLVEHRRAGSPHWVRAAPLLVQISEVTISGLEPGWRYQFRVSAENAVGMSDPSELSEPITVTLQRSAVTAPRFTQELEDKVALENEKIEFVVHFLGQPAPKVCWFKDGFEIFSSRRIRILTESDRSVLTVHQTSLSDEGEIKCTATNRAGHVSTKAALAVEAPPSIRLPRQYEDGLLFEIGELIRLKVSVAGRPTPLVFWSHNGESIKNNDRYEVEYVDKSSVLKVNEAHRNDRGEYQIKAVNKLGEDTQSFLVTVTDKPSPPSRARVVMALGRSVTLSWGSPEDDGGCKIGNYIVEYYRLGWNVWLKAATSRQLTTMLGDLIEGSEYKFRIKAESPYGVSDPSEESEVVFIPDPKRGILLPQSRGRSQPKDILQEVTTPIATRRKNKPRSQSSSRVEHGYREPDVISNIPNSGVPVRPERSKIKSPPKTPEASPLITRKQVEAQVNKKIFELSDRSSMARELAYGSPDIKMRWDSDLAPNYLSSLSSSSDKSRTPSPAAEEQFNHKVYAVKIEPPSPPPPPPSNASRSPSPDIRKIKSPRENNENFTGSSEFMLVLYSDEHEKGQSDFDFDDISVPPPMSLSAPELGAEPPLFNGLKSSASSTELLHERAMMRFYQAAEAEEAELERKRKAKENKSHTMDVPKILINSKDDQDIVGLDRQHSLRRRMSAGGISHQQTLWAQRRHSLRSSGEMKGDILQTGLHKFPFTSDMKREIMNKKKKISIAEEDKWAEDYVSSTEEDSESSEEDRVPSSEDEKLFREKLSRRISYEDEDEVDTYHPGMRSEPFEILTKRKEPPDPNFIPKPILKKTDYEEELNENKLIPSLYVQEVEEKPKKRSHSPIPQNITNLLKKERSYSLVDGEADIKTVRNKFQPSIPTTPRPRSFSLLPQKELLSKQLEIPEDFILPESVNKVAPGYSISAVAQISGIAAAGVIIPEKLLDRKKDEEEAKVVIDHYGDIVKNYGKRKRSNPQIHLDRDSLKKLAEDVETPQAIFEAPDPQIESTSPTHSFNNSYNDKPTEVIENKSSKENLKTVHEPSRNQKVSPERKRERTLSKSPPKQMVHRETSPRKSPSRSNLSISPVRAENWSTLKSSNKKVEKPRRKTSPSPMRREVGRKTSPSPLPKDRVRKTSPSPLPKERRRKTSPSPLSKDRVRKTSPSPLPKERVRKTSQSPMRRERKTSPSPFRTNPTTLPIPEQKRRPMLREIMTQTSVGLESLDSDSWSRTSSPSGRTQKQEELMARAEVKVRTALDYVTDLAMFIVACWLYLFNNELLALPVLLVMVYRQLQAEIAKRIPKWILRRLHKKKKQ
ncbi:uncharacterized protein LOC108913039 [Anoplophora glabripennis]|uniref:uncharacterized protein LOC108913039 n=1 Tax=Anoplophora glabripennis TaxID=217634 RepID=UPI00087391DB|nr:uncharacterized protein LOC108913039 [Anoplophora glabripennis]